MSKTLLAIAIFIVYISSAFSTETIFEDSFFGWKDLFVSFPKMKVSGTFFGTRDVMGGSNFIVSSFRHGEIARLEKDPTLERGRGNQYIAKARFKALDYSVLILYLLVLVGMGFYFSKREKGTEDFFLAGHRIPWWAAGISIFGTQLSAITFMSVPAKTYATDWTYFIMSLGIAAVAPLIVWVFLPFYRRLNVTSAYEYLEKRFNVSVRMLGSVAFILYQLGRMGVVLFLPAIALSTVTGMNVFLCIALMGLLSTFYTVLGGIEAVIWTDVLQVIVLVGGALLSILLITLNVDGGFSGIIRIGLAHGKFKLADWTFNFTSATFWVMVISWLGQLVPYASDQTVIQRYLTTKDEKQAAQGIWTNAILSIPSTILFFGVGTALFVFFKGRPDLLNPGLSTDAVFPWFIALKLPTGVAGIVIAGIFAATMSSLDSSLNSVSTAIVTDFYQRFHSDVADSASLKIARWLTVLLGIIATGTALLMATLNISSLWDVFLKIMGLFGGGLAGLFLLGVMTQRSHGTGALIGFLTSAIVQYFIQEATDIHFLLYSATGIVSCFLVGYMVSLIIPPKKDIENELTIYTLSKRRSSKP